MLLSEEWPLPAHSSINPPLPEVCIDCFCKAPRVSKEEQVPFIKTAGFLLTCLGQPKARSDWTEVFRKLAVLCAWDCLTFFQFKVFQNAQKKKVTLIFVLPKIFAKFWLIPNLLLWNVIKKNNNRSFKCRISSNDNWRLVAEEMSPFPPMFIKKKNQILHGKIQNIHTIKHKLQVLTIILINVLQVKTFCFKDLQYYIIEWNIYVFYSDYLFSFSCSIFYTKVIYYCQMYLILKS